MDMQFFIETIKSGGVYDILKIGSVGAVKELASQLKSIFNGQSLTEKDYTRIAEIIEKADERDLKNEDYFEAYLKSSKELKEFVESKKSNDTSYQNTYGDGSHIFNDVHGNIKITYGVDTEKK